MISANRDLTNLENILFQIFISGVGLTGSYILGKWATEDVEREAIRPHARSAFRRLVSLYQSLSRIAHMVASSESDEENAKMLALREIIIREIRTADDALEDWADIVPEEVKRYREEIRQIELRGNGDD